VIDLRAQRCDESVGAAQWNAVTVSDADLEPGNEFTSMVLTVRDADTGEVLHTQEMVDSNGVLDLSDVDTAAHPALSVDATASSVDGNPAWADGNPPKATLSWTSDPLSACFHTTAAADCPPATDAVGIEVNSESTTPSSASAVLSLEAAPGCETATTPTTTGTTTPTTPTTTPVSTSPGGGSSTLPRTGGDSMMKVWFALMLIVVGAALIFGQWLWGRPVGEHAMARRRVRRP
jgi:hypothetical protein